MQEYYIGADMGTTNLKVCIYDENAVELASASRRCDTQYTDIGGALQSPEQWWSNFVSALTELRQHTAGMQCRSICISSHVPALIALAEDGSVLYPAMIWQDYSGVREAAELEANYTSLLRRNNPSKVQPYHFIAKLLWFMRHEPELYQKTWKFVQPKDYLNFKLTGKAFLDEAQCGVNHFYNLFEHRFDPELAAAVDPALLEKLPEVVLPEDCIGTISPEVAAQLQLPPTVQVFAGGVDSCAAALGANMFQRGALSFSLGTGANVMLLCRLQDIRQFNPHANLVRHAYGDLYLPMSTMTNAGNVLDWYLNQMAPQYQQAAAKAHCSPYDLVFQDAQKSDPGCRGLLFLPYLVGETAPIPSPNAKGVFFGLSAASNFCDMARAILESMCYALRHTTEAFLETISADVTDCVNVCGGQTRQPFWMQMLADVLQRPVQVYRDITPAPRGNAMVGILQLHQGLTPASFCGPYDMYLPDPGRKDVYEQQFSRYKQLSAAINHLF